jgi:hypothetical protein
VHVMRCVARLQFVGGGVVEYLAHKLDPSWWNNR